MRKKFTSLYSLNKSRRILRQSYKLYRRKAATLDAVQKERLQSLFTSLQTAIAQGDAEIANRLAHSLEDSIRKFIHKTFWDTIRDLGVALLFALIVAFAIRQMWFELYTIPSGSMRPTLKEEDFLLVSKTDFGINTLNRTGHFTFDPSLVERGSIVIFSGENLDMPDPDTTYFLVIPGKKQLVKRLIGKPGDTLYFYGGQIFGVSAEGRDLCELRDPKWFQNLEHIPFIRFDGKAQTPNKPSNGAFSPVVFHQMNEPVARLTLQPQGGVSGEMLYPKGAPLKNYYDLWGFKNFAMARLLTQSQANQLHPTLVKDQPSSPLYLELRHHPSLGAAMLGLDEYRRLRPELTISASIIPLDGEKIDAIMSHMVTCRFVVKDGMAARFGASFSHPASLPRLTGVPDGTYEIQDGKAYRVLWTGITKQLPDNHPLLKRDPQHVQLLYNLGIEMDNHYLPSQHNHYFSSRYAYFFNHDLHLLGAPIFFKNDPLLTLFLQKEYQKQSFSTTYVPFDDAGPPVTKEGTIDTDFIRRFGLKIPVGMYLMLGDNHAMSGDSRQFGFVPQDNLRGGASWILWPPGSRWGRPPQPILNHFTLPNIAVWSIFLIISISSTIYLRRKYAKPLRF